jgi:copper homeostasis protein
MQQKANERNTRGPTLEVIACSVSDAVEAQSGGAGRLEIVRDLASGGLTPPLELVQEILAAVTLPVRVMLREGNSYEVSGHIERERLCAAATALSGLNVDGVVLGFLRSREVDIQLTESVLSCAPNLRATFHHAFEDTDDPFSAIQTLKRVAQVDRILTSGGSGDWTEKIQRLARYKEQAGPEIEILAGGGIDQQSIRMICQATGIREFHVGRAAREPASAQGEVRATRVRALVESIVVSNA